MPGVKFPFQKSLHDGAEGFETWSVKLLCLRHPLVQGLVAPKTQHIRGEGGRCGDVLFTGFPTCDVGFSSSVLCLLSSACKVARYFGESSLTRRGELSLALAIMVSIRYFERDGELA